MESVIKNVGVVGAGFMGAGVAEVTAKAGFPTTVVKATAGSLEQVRGKLERSFARAVEKKKLTPEARDAALGRLTFATELGALAGADLVVESIVEDLGAKQALFAHLAKLTPPRTILASNTSTLRVSEIAAAGGRRERTIGLHFFSPVPAMQLVELAHLAETPAEVVESAARFVAELGKTAVPVLDSSGFIVNRLLVPLLVGAITAYEQGLARPEQIDTAMRLGCAHPMGPLALSDLIGLDIVYAMAKLLHADFKDARYRAPALLRRLVQRGELGKKTGLGFYDYRTDPPQANEKIWHLVRGGAFLEHEADHAA